MGETSAVCTARTHTTTTAWKVGCVCPQSRERFARYWKRYRYDRARGRRRLVDATGTRRRLQALSALGWSMDAVAPYFGVGLAAVHKWRIAEQVNTTTAERVRAVYDHLSLTQGPSRRSQLNAARMGWPPPLAWDDDSIDNPDAGPAEGWRRTRQDDLRAAREDRERRSAEIRRLNSLGLTAGLIAQRMGVSDRTVVRHRRKEAS